MAKSTPKKNNKGKTTTKAAQRKPAAAASKAKPKPKSKTPVRASARRPEKPAAPVRRSTNGAPRRTPEPPAPAPASAGRVPINGEKPVKNQAGLKAKELAFFRDLLLAKRRELVGDVYSMEQEALQGGGGSNLSNLPIHMADMGTDNYEQEFTLGLVEKDRQVLRDIDIALRKMRDGTYGICEGTGKTISRARLEAQPWARYSIEHAREMEKRTMRRFG